MYVSPSSPPARLPSSNRTSAIEPDLAPTLSQPIPFTRFTPGLGLLLDGTSPDPMRDYNNRSTVSPSSVATTPLDTASFDESHGSQQHTVAETSSVHAPLSVHDDEMKYGPRSEDSHHSLSASRSFPQLFRSGGSPISTGSSPLSSDREDHGVTHRRAKKLARLLGSNSMSRALLSRTPGHRRRHLDSVDMHATPNSPDQPHRRAPIPPVPSATHFS